MFSEISLFEQTVNNLTYFLVPIQSEACGGKQTLHFCYSVTGVNIAVLATGQNRYIPLCVIEIFQVGWLVDWLYFMAYQPLWVI